MSSGRNPKIYVFDVDGTLTPPCQSMSSEMQAALRKILSENTCAIITGSDYEKTRLQIPHDILMDLGMSIVVVVMSYMKKGQK